MRSRGHLLYRRIADDLRLAIRGGRWAPGHRLPRVRELSAEYDCSTQTVHRALKLLQQEGLILARQGSGVRVRDPKRDRGRRILAVFPDWHSLKDQSYPAQFLLGTTAAATERRLSVETLMFTDQSELADLPERVAREAYAGVVWSHCTVPVVVGRLHEMEVKQTFIHHRPDFLGVPVTRDALAPAADRLAAELLAAGVRSIGLVGCHRRLDVGFLEFVTGTVQRQLTAAGLVIPEPHGRCLTGYGGLSHETRVLLEHFFAATREVDAYWFTTPNHLQLACDLMARQGRDLSAEKTLAVFSINSWPIAQADYVLQSAVRRHAHRATALLHEWMETETPPADVDIPVELVVADDLAGDGDGREKPG